LILLRIRERVPWQLDLLVDKAPHDLANSTLHVVGPSLSIETVTQGFFLIGGLSYDCLTRPAQGR
jgi:hypothetical protein